MNAPEYGRLDVTCPHCKKPFRVPISTARATLIQPAAPVRRAGDGRARRIKSKRLEGAQEIAERRGYETPSEAQQRLNQDRNVEDLR